MTKPFDSFSAFYPVYLRMHDHPVNRRLHVVGNVLGVGAIALRSREAMVESWRWRPWRPTGSRGSVTGISSAIAGSLSLSFYGMNRQLENDLGLLRPKTLDPFCSPAPARRIGRLLQGGVHEPPVSRIEVLALPGAHQLVDARLRQLTTNDDPRPSNREDLAIHREDVLRAEHSADGSRCDRPAKTEKTGAKVGGTGAPRPISSSIPSLRPSPLHASRSPGAPGRLILHH